MKKVILSITMALPLMFASCSQEMPEIVDAGTAVSDSRESFDVIEEQTVTESELFADAVRDIKDYASSQMLESLNESYQKANSQLTPLTPGSRAIIGTYKTVRVTYQTVDEANRPVTASALIVYPLLKKMDKVMLINHGTTIGFMLVPTQYTSIEAIMAATGALCILPDYLGHGVAASHPDLYLNADVQGKNSVDALLKLLDYAKQKKLPLASNFKTYITGYSQGGAVSLAALRRVQQLDKKTQQSLHIAKAYCGGCPADLRLTFETYMKEYDEGKTIGLGSVVPAVINSMFNSYPDEMADLNYLDFFADYAVKTGVPQAIRANKESAIDMMLPLSVKLDKILNFDYMAKNPEHLNRLLSLMDRQNLCRDWKPQYPLRLLHGNPDAIVPYANFEEAYAGLKNEYMERPIIVKTTKNAPAIIQHIESMVVMLSGILIGGI